MKTGAPSFRTISPAFSRLDQIRTYSYTVDKVSGDDYGVNEVVEVFNRLNKAGTTLTKSDLALAHVCSIWPEARAEMRRFRDDLRRRDFDFDFDFLVRCLAGVTAGSILLEGTFFKTPADDLKSAWNRLVPSLERLVSVLRAELCVADTKDIPSTAAPSSRDRISRSTRVVIFRRMNSSVGSFGGFPWPVSGHDIPVPPRQLCSRMSHASRVTLPILLSNLRTPSGGSAVVSPFRPPIWKERELEAP